MNQTVNDRDDQYYEELLGAAAFGTLVEEEQAELEAYLASSPSARAELAELRALAADLPLLVNEMEPPPALRDRIERAVLAEAAWPQAPVANEITEPESASARPENGHPAPLPLDFTAVAEQREPRRLPTWRNSLLAVAAALLIALASGIAVDRIFLQNDDDATSEMTIAFSLTPSTPMPDVSAQLTYDPDSQMFRLETENMPSAPADQVYQVWLIDQAGVPQPKGVMDEPSFVVAADMHNYQAFAITVEPGPIGSDAPTTKPFFVAPLDEATTS